MDTRKVQQLGKSTLALTLPAKWTNENDVQKGDELTIHSNELGILTLITDAPNQPNRIATVHAKDLDTQALERAIISQYVLGRQVIIIESDDELTDEHLAAVYGAEKQLMGLGVVEETPTDISVRCSVNSEDFTIDNLIDRLETTGSTMRSEATKAFLHGNTELARRAINRERQANKIFVLLLRLIFTSYRSPKQVRAVGLEKELDLIGYRSVAKNLELTADDAEDIANVVVTTDGETSVADRSIRRKLAEFSTQVDELSSLAIRAIVERDYDLYIQCRKRFADIEADEEAILAELPDTESAELLQIRQVLVSLHQTAEYAMRNAEIAANFALNQESRYVTIH